MNYNIIYMFYTCMCIFLPIVKKLSHLTLKAVCKPKVVLKLPSHLFKKIMKL